LAAARIERVERSVHDAGLDALLITHPANIAYLTGLNASTAIAVVLPARARCILIVDSRYATSARALESAMPRLAVRVASGSLDEDAARQVTELDVHRVGIEADHLTLARFDRLTKLLGTGPTTEDVVLTATTRIVERLRAVKDAEEIRTLREAGRRISIVARQARTFIRPGSTERSVAAAVDAAMREAGFDRPAFETIVASGANAALPHARPTDRVIQDNEGVLLDFGGVYDGYCVDLTRTVHIGPMPEGFRRLFDAVREAQAAAIGAVKAGVQGLDVDRAARQVMSGHGLGEAFGHGTGHGLGLEVHEEPRISPLAPADEPLQAGMVVTIEPGAYVPGTGGVRIEDDVLVTVGGCELLTDVPIEL
jgi:Xaa-Pro aminopeptidase